MTSSSLIIASDWNLVSQQNTFQRIVHLSMTVLGHVYAMCLLGNARQIDAAFVSLCQREDLLRYFCMLSIVTLL